MRAGAAGLTSLGLAHVWIAATRGTALLWLGVLLPAPYAAAAWRWLLSAGERAWLLGRTEALSVRAGIAPSG